MLVVCGAVSVALLIPLFGVFIAQMIRLIIDAVTERRRVASWAKTLDSLTLNQLQEELKALESGMEMKAAFASVSQEDFDSYQWDKSQVAILEEHIEQRLYKLEKNR
jgi:uncharacterized membrane protein YgcG